MSAAARLRGMLADSGAEAEAHFRRAMELGGDLPFTAALIDLRHGNRLVVEGRYHDAAGPLLRAWDRFADLDAPGWLEQTEAALRAADVAPPPTPQAPALTADERLLAAAVAGGSSVEAVAGSLLISTRTAEDRLGRALGKLGSASRAGLRDDTGHETDEERYRCRLLGRFQVSRGDQDVTPPPGILATAVQLVALRGSLHVEEVVEALWPDVEPARGRTRLRNVLARIRRASGDLLVRTGENLSLSPRVDVDVDAFEAAAGRALQGDPADIEEALESYGGDLLPESVYLAWAAAPRERLRRRRVQLLDLAAEAAEQRGRVDEAIRHLEEAIDAEPYDETRYVQVARLLGTERRGAAHDVIERARRRLADLDLEPSPALEEAASQLRCGGRDRRTSASHAGGTAAP